MKNISEAEKFVTERSIQLRSPLISVLGLLRLMRITPDESEKIKYLDLIEQRILKLEGYIKEYDDLYKNKFHENLERFSLKSMVNQIIGETSDSFHKEIDFIITGKVDKIVSDPLQVKVILQKIIRNAIKYQKIKEENKMVKISLNEDEKAYFATVEDNGTGMFQEEVDDLVNMFYSDNDNKWSNRGFHKVKESLKNINGTCSIESKFGSGTRFTIKFPTGLNNCSKICLKTTYGSV